jgi:hypothetical protein
MNTSWPLNVSSASGVSLWMINLSMRAQRQSCLVTFPRLQVNSLINTLSLPSLSSMDGNPVIIQTRSIMDCKLARSWPPTVFPNLLDRFLQVYNQTRLNTASKCISRLAQSCPPRASQNSLDSGLHVYLQTGLITEWKGTYTFARSRPPSASPYSLGHDLGVYPRVHSIIIVRSPSNCSQAPPAACPDIPCVDG